MSPERLRITSRALFPGLLFSLFWPIAPAAASASAPSGVRDSAFPSTTSSTGCGSGSLVSLSYVDGSSVKLEQVIGDCDWQYRDYLTGTGACKATASQTATRFDILGNGQGSSFEDNGKMIFLFGDTISTNPSVVNFHAHDPIAWSTNTDPEAGLLLNFFTNSDGSPLFVEPPGVKMGADDVPNAGISLSDGIYLVCNTGSDTSQADPQATDYSVLARFDEKTKTFTTGRTISQLPGGHFVFTSLHASGTDVLMFGAGAYRGSDIYLSTTPAATFESGEGTRYFSGLAGGQPTWSNRESDAVPIVQDNPAGGPPWPNDSPTVGNLSVIYSKDLGLWLMTYDGGRQTEKTRGVYFSYASQPWGPWCTPQLIFNEARDNGWGVFIHNPNIQPDPPGDGLNGPTIGSNDPATTPGGGFAPLLIERFTRVDGNILRIYYTLSTWNPYTVVKMRSSFTIARTDTALCIDDQPGDRRFAVQVAYRTSEGGGLQGDGHAIPLSPVGISKGGAFWFFSPDNPEMLVKLLDGCAANGQRWFFASAGTNVGFTATVTDTLTGKQQTYTNPDLTPAAAIEDTSFESCAAASGLLSAAPGSSRTSAKPQARAWEVDDFATPENAAPCVAGPVTLCIDGSPGDNRFKVEVAYHTSQGGGLSGNGQAIPLAPVGITHGGAFWFFSPDNPEMLVKVVDGCGVNGAQWFFSSAGTNVGLTMTVTDTTTGEQKIYTNNDLNPAQPIQDTSAFLNCP